MPGTRPSMTKKESGVCLLAHVLNGKPGDAFVIVAERFQLVLGDEFVEIVVRLVAGQFLDADVDEIGRVLAVGAHDLRRRLAPPYLVFGEGLRAVVLAAEAVREGARFETCLRPTV